MLNARVIGGWLIIAAASGLAAVSGVLAYNGFEAMISIPFAGWIGPCVAASLIGLGIAVESEVRSKRWIGAAVLGAMLISAGLLDRHSGELALKSKVEAASQVDADRRQAFAVATKATTEAEKVIADREAKIAILEGDNIVAAQKLLGVDPDGEWGPDTRDARKQRAGKYQADIDAARAIVRENTPTIAAGVPASELPFKLSDAELYATLITALSIILAFAGSYVAHGLKTEPTAEEVLDELESTTSELESEVFDLASFLTDVRKQRRAA